MSYSKEVESSIYFKFHVGDRKVQTLHPATIVDNLTQLNSEKLRLPVTLYYEVKKKEYQTKMASLVVLMKHAKGIKKVGEINLDFAKFLNKEIKSQFCNATLQNCPDKAASLQFQITFEKQEKHNERSRTPEVPKKPSQVVEENKSELVNAIRQSIVQKQVEGCKNCQSLEEDVKMKDQEIEELQTKLQQKKQKLEQKDQQIEEMKVLLKQKDEELQGKDLQILRFKEDIRKTLDGSPIDVKEMKTENLLMRQKLQEMLDQEYKHINLINLLKKEVDNQKQDWEEQREQLEQENARINELYQQCFQKLSELQLKLKLRNTEQDINKKETEMLKEEVDGCHKKLVEMENDIMKYKQLQVDAMQAFLELGDSKIIDIYESYLY